MQFQEALDCFKMTFVWISWLNTKLYNAWRFHELTFCVCDETKDGLHQRSKDMPVLRVRLSDKRKWPDLITVLNCASI